jgi:hypothetical protein
MPGNILAFYAGAPVGLLFAWIREEMAVRKILRTENAGLLRMAAE